MEKFDPKKSSGSDSVREKRGLDRDDTGRTNEDNYAAFTKDKRRRITRFEKNEPQPRKYSRESEFYSEKPEKPEKPERQERQERPERPFHSEDERRSFNPNFTRDNRKRDDNRPDRHNSGFGRDENNGNRTGSSSDYGNRKYPRTNGAGPKKYQDHRSGSYHTGSDDERNPGLYDPSFIKSHKSQKDRPYQGGRQAPRKGYGSDRNDPRKSKRPEHGLNPDGTYPTFPAPALRKEMRLNRYLAAAGTCSRREADELIRSGLVTVNGVKVVEMGSKVSPGDVVAYGGQTMRSEKKVYILMNKPKGYVTTIEDPHADKTVMDLIRGSVAERLYPVGRLDKNSLGVLLITNDGDMTTRLTHPSYDKKKIYQVSLNKPLTKADMERMVEGIELEDGEVHADAVNYVNNNKREIGIEIHSGRNRIIRRIFEYLGYKVNKLDRVYFAGLTKKNLQRGEWRFLTSREVEILKSGLHE